MTLGPRRLASVADRLGVNHSTVLRRTLLAMIGSTDLRERQEE